MAIDANIALGQPAPNLLQSLGQATALKGQMLQQNQLTQQMGANQATSQAMQQAYDPATGQLDYNKLTQIMSQDPRAAYNLLPTQNAILENQQKRTNVDTGQFDLALKRTNYLQGQYGALMGKDNLSPQDLVQVAAEGVKNGLFPADQAVRILQTAPQDPAQLKSWTQQQFMQQADNAARLQMVMPQNAMLNTGGVNYATSTNPMNGKVTVTGVIGNTMSPGEAASPIGAVDPQTGMPINITKQQFSDQANGMGAAQQPPTMGLPGTGTNGRYPQGPASQGPAQGVATGLAPGVAAAAEVTARGGAEDAQALNRQAAAAAQTRYQFQNMRETLTNTDTGPGTDYRNTAMSFAQALAPDVAKAVGIDPQKIASYEELHKYATQATQATLQSLGSGTDSALASAVNANPGTQLSKLGNQQILDVLQAGSDAIIAKNNAWQQEQASKGINANYNQFNAKWTKDIDPRVFAVTNMDQPTAIKMFNSLKPAEQAKFKQSMRTAIQQGIIPNPAQQQQ